MTWIPEAGDVFTPRIKPLTRYVEKITPAGLVASKVVEESRSYGTELFVATASDATVVVGRNVFSQSLLPYSGPQIFAVDHHNFLPVSPEVKAALGINEKQEAA